MDTRRVLYLLDILNRETQGQTERLAELYRIAIEDNDDVIELKKLISDCVFFSGTGTGMLEQSRELIDSLYANPTKALELISDLRRARETIEQELKNCTGLMKRSLPFSDILTVLRKGDVENYRASLTLTAAAATYLIAVYDGPAALRELSWNDSAGLPEMLNAINTRFLPALFRVRHPSYSWVIRKKHMGGKALLGGDCFYLSYESTVSVENLCRLYKKEPMGRHAYLNISAYEKDENDVPYCWGVGNIMRFSIDNALRLLRDSVAVQLRSPRYAELNSKMPVPIECARILSDGKPFCITPDELVLAMNRWYVGHEIEERKRHRICLICGNHVENGRLACPSHFSRELT